MYLALEMVALISHAPRGEEHVSKLVLFNDGKALPIGPVQNRHTHAWFTGAVWVEVHLEWQWGEW